MGFLRFAMCSHFSRGPEHIVEYPATAVINSPLLWHQYDRFQDRRRLRTCTDSLKFTFPNAKPLRLDYLVSKMPTRSFRNDELMDLRSFAAAPLAPRSDLLTKRIPRFAARANFCGSTARIEFTSGVRETVFFGSRRLSRKHW